MSQQNHFCENCGKSLQAGARFCESCGHAAGASNAAGAVPSGPATASSGFAITPCPKCGQADQADRAASAVERLKKIPEKDEPTDEEIEQQTQREEVIEALEKPEPPKAVSCFLWGFVVFIPLIGFFIMLMSPVRKGLKIFLAGILLVFLVAAVVSSTAAGLQIYQSGAVYFLGLFMIIYYWAALWYSSFYHQTEFEMRLKPEYEKALPRWGHLCYCGRCNVIYFDDAPPHDRRFVPANEAQSFLRP